jgi:ABC-type amino acid transport substrate-binding protein
MKPLQTIIIAMICAAVVSYATVKIVVPQSMPAAKAETKKESAYDRIMRTGVIRCGVYVWPPYIEKDANTGELRGFTKDILTRIIGLLDLKPQFIELQVGMQKQDLESGKVDAICGDGPWYASSIKYISYTNGYSLTPVYAYKRKGDDRITTLAQLNSKDVKFVGLDGDLSFDLAKSFYPNAQLQTLASTVDPSQLLLNVVTKKADVTITEPVGAKKFMDSNPDTIERVSDKPLAVFKGGFSVAKNETQLLETLNNAIEVAIDTGIIDQELDKYDPDRKMMLRPKTYYEVK